MSMPWVKRISWFLAIILSLAAAALSLWIVIPAPILLLLPLGVAVPELSPWLVGLNGSLLLIWWLGGRRNPRLKQLRGGFLILSALALSLSLLPSLQVAATQQQATLAMTRAFGPESLQSPPPAPEGRLRSHPVNWLDLFRIPAQPDVREQSGLVFAHPAGVPLEMRVYQPARSGTYPGVVMIYGGAWQWGEPTANAEFGRYLAAQGYVVWAIDYRHAPQFRFPAQLEDVQAALAFIRDHAREYETDPQRLALLGRSAGAHLAMLAAYQTSPLPIRAVVNYYGPVDLVMGYDDRPTPDPIDIRACLRAFLGGTPQDQLPLYRQASPIQWVRPGLPPTLLIYASRDHLVQAKFGRRMATKLQSAGNQAGLIEVPWAEHAFDLVFPGLGSQLTLYYTERFLAWALRA